MKEDIKKCLVGIGAIAAIALIICWLMMLYGCTFNFHNFAVKGEVADRIIQEEPITPVEIRTVPPVDPLKENVILTIPELKTEVKPLEIEHIVNLENK